MADSATLVAVGAPVPDRAHARVRGRGSRVAPWERGLSSVGLRLGGRDRIIMVGLRRRVPSEVARGAFTVRRSGDAQAIAAPGPPRMCPPLRWRRRGSQSGPISHSILPTRNTGVVPQPAARRPSAHTCIRPLYRSSNNLRLSVWDDVRSRYRYIPLASARPSPSRPSQWMV